MKKFFSLLVIFSLLISLELVCQQTENIPENEPTNEVIQEEKESGQEEAISVPEEKGIHQILKQKFIEGGVEWMTPILILLIFGLAISIERIFYLNLSTINTEKFLKELEDKLFNNGIEEAKDYCRNVRGPIASISYQALDRFDQGLEAVEKSIISYGSVQSSNLEKGLAWLSMIIALAPMLGFLGTVIGMVQAFDAIEAAGDISPTIVAGGMKVALLTTVFGLIVAIIIQVFYNYIVNKIDSLVLKMEDASVSLMDILIKFKENKTK